MESILCIARNSIRHYVRCMRGRREQTGQHWVRKWISQETQKFNITGNVEIIFFLPTRNLFWTFVQYYFSASRWWQLKFLTLEPPASNEKQKPRFIIFWFSENFVSTNYLFGNNVAAYWPAITKCTLQGRIQTIHCLQGLFSIFSLPLSSSLKIIVTMICLMTNMLWCHGVTRVPLYCHFHTTMPL